MSIAKPIQFVSGFKSKHPEVRFKAASDLHRYVSTNYFNEVINNRISKYFINGILQVKNGLVELSPEDMDAFMHEMNKYICDMVSSSDANENKGGILAIRK